MQSCWPVCATAARWARWPWRVTMWCLAGVHACTDIATAATQVHAENGEAVEHGRAAVFASGVTGPEGHGLSRPAALEEEATGRAIRLAALVGAPLYVVHVMAAGAAQQVAAARAAGQRVIGEAVLSGAQQRTPIVVAVAHSRLC